MLSLLLRRRRPPHCHAGRRFSSETSHESTQIRPGFLEQPSPRPLLVQNPPAPTPSPAAASPLRSASSSYAIAATVVSASALAAYVALSFSDRPSPRSDRIYSDMEETLERSKNSVRRILDRMSQTGAAASVLWKSLVSMLSSANHGVRSGFEFRVAALLADISAANEARRAAIVGAGGGAVVDWLLDSVAISGHGGDRIGTQSESARALAHLIADPNVCHAVLGRPYAIPNLLRFIFSFQPKKSKSVKHSAKDGSDVCKGRSMLVAAIMDIITSNCDSVDQPLKPLLPASADTRDIATALEVVEEGGLRLEVVDEDGDNDDGDNGIQGIGIKVLGGTTILGFSSKESILELSQPLHYQLLRPRERYQNLELKENISSSSRHERFSFTIPGLWDDLQREHVAVPFAAWALANWALASELNRTRILELDSDGQAIMTTLRAPERSVKWHGCLVARALVDDPKLPLNVSVPDWSSSLLSTAFHASNSEDVTLAQVALSAFLVSIKRSNEAKVVMMEKGLDLIRGIGKQSEKHWHLRETLAKVLELIYNGDMHLSLEESQRWSGILLHWIIDESSNLTTRLSAMKTLSFIMEDFGPHSIPISQGWLTILLNEVLGSSKKANMKGNNPPKSDKVKTQIDQSNAQSAVQISNELATSVVKLTGFQSDLKSDTSGNSPFNDFLSLEPFSTLIKNTKKNSLPKFDAADSAIATLKGIKALTELCAEDTVCQCKIADLGALVLLRRYLLCDDYEKLAANEAYLASRVLEPQSLNASVPGDSPNKNQNIEPSSVRVPPTAHIRKHAARLLVILSLLPRVKKVISADLILCKWLEDCACGNIPCCNDQKIQSYARATLLNIFCLEPSETQVLNYMPPVDLKDPKRKCPLYEDMIFLLNPELPHWKVSQKHDENHSDGSFGQMLVSGPSSPCSVGQCEENNSDNSSCLVNSEQESESSFPLLDVVFVHGLRGGPFKSWRIADNKSSTTSKAGLVESIDLEAGKLGTCWPSEWLGADFPCARIFSVKYKTNLTQWSGATLPLQEVSSMLLRKLTRAGIGDRPVVFVTHSMGGLVVKEMLHEAKLNNLEEFVKNTIGVVFYSCPHFGSKLADMPWRMGLVLRPALTIGELRSGSPRLLELNDYVRQLYKKGLLDVLSFSETQVTPIVEGYGGWGLRMEIVPIESAFPGFGELVVLDSTDHVNSCKPVSQTDPSYAKTLEFLKKLKDHLGVSSSAKQDKHTG
ncbi:uncharacterized protein LOC122016621 isoform X1 [Zingiber officinale]|uniref:uncharacterized protein LOC122016621 isoform X1 n=2 Tax=Zingiber officinale TaxID=94328 RepID=UPI001C4D404B|nr:uncharacterized protein LOC122016621 isoform X1 [Zingiber officinale]